MTAIQNITAASTNSSATSTALTAISSPQDLQNEFLTLLVTQMQNQDPLNPMDSSEVTSQLAQISTVSGIGQLNSTMQSLLSSMSAQQSVQAASLVGQGVMVSGNQLNLSNSNAVFGVSLPQAVTSMTVTVTDAAGNIVDQMDVGPQAAGTALMQWDGSTLSGGTAADGSYTVSVTASANGQSVTASTMSYGVVNAVTPGTGTSATSLNISGIGTVPLSAVQQIL